MAKRPKPIRLTKQRAEALLHVFEVGANDVEEAVKDGIKLAIDAEEMRVVKQRGQRLLQARDAAEIIRDRYITPPAKKNPEALW